MWSFLPKLNIISLMRKEPADLSILVLGSSAMNFFYWMDFTGYWAERAKKEEQKIEVLKKQMQNSRERLKKILEARAKEKLVESCSKF